MGSVEDFHLVVFVFWCESKELGGRGSSRFPCVTAMVETSSDRVSEYYIKNSVRHQRWSSFAKRANGINNLTVSAKKLHCRLPTWFQMQIWLRGTVNLKEWGCGEVGVGMKVHWIGGRRLVHKEVVEVESNYKNSYFWWFGSDSSIFKTSWRFLQDVITSKTSWKTIIWYAEDILQTSLRHVFITFSRHLGDQKINSINEGVTSMAYNF